MDCELLPRAQCRETMEQAQAEARAHGVKDVEVLMLAGAEALTRFANNTIHQNVAERTRHVSVRCQENNRTARATTNRTDAESIRRATRQAIAILRVQQADEKLPPMARPDKVVPVARWYSGTAGCAPMKRALLVKEVIQLCEEAGLTVAGIVSTEETVEALLNSEGVFCYHPETMATFSITAMAADSSGWAKSSSTDLEKLDVAALAKRAAGKAVSSGNPRELAPGRYTVILEPPAVLDLVGQIFGDFSGTALEDKRSFLTDRLGEKLFGENITIRDDVFHPLQAGAPFDGEGVGRQGLSLVQSGVAGEVAWCRAAAARNGRQPTGHGFPLPNPIGEMPQNLAIEGGGSSLDEMIRSTKRGILVTRLWYIREVDPYTKLMTGMTRDGTFLIEDGEVRGGLRNFRFNQSVVELLGNVEMLGPALRTSGEETFDMVVPAMKVREFQFSEVTRF